MPNADMLEILLKSKVFKGLSAEYLKEIADRGDIVTFEKNETIIIKRARDSNRELDICFH